MLMQRKAPSLLLRNARLGVARIVLCGVLLGGIVFNASAAPALPYGSYAAERQMMLEQLPCKWISMNGRDGIRREDSGYDFLCKGGVWATVSLMMDESKMSRDGIGRVRLLFREWPEDIHPGGGEAYVAQEFLQYVLAHFVPANMSDSVQEAFWRNKDKSWKVKGLTMTVGLEDMGNHRVRRLEISGNVGAVTPLVTLPVKTEAAPSTVVPVMPEVTLSPAPMPAKVEPVKPVVQTQEKPGQKKGWGWGNKAAEELPVVKPAMVTPTAVVAEPVKVEPAKPVKEEKKAGKWGWLFNPADHAANEVLGEPSKTVVVAPVATSTTTAVAVPTVVVSGTAVSVTTPPVFSKEAEPASLVTPVAPPAVSDTLVPSALDRTLGRTAAPTNFSAYNQAEALTRKYELNALEDPNAMPKVTGAAAPVPESEAAQESGLMKAPESTATAPALTPVPTPTVTTPTAAGLLKEEPKADEPAVPSNDPRFNPQRDIPQLKFVPKAQPAPKPDQVIKFEDEKSGL